VGLFHERLGLSRRRIVLSLGRLPVRWLLFLLQLLLLLLVFLLQLLRLLLMALLYLLPFARHSPFVYPGSRALGPASAGVCLVPAAAS